ncbi:hypothetical protein BGZ90_007822, partial [Linnemannia elongata]
MNRDAEVGLDDAVVLILLAASVCTAGRADAAANDIARDPDKERIAARCRIIITPRRAG